MYSVDGAARRGRAEGPDEGFLSSGTQSWIRDSSPRYSARDKGKFTDMAPELRRRVLCGGVRRQSLTVSRNFRARRRGPARKIIFGPVRFGICPQPGTRQFSAGAERFRKRLADIRTRAEAFRPHPKVR